MAEEQAPQSILAEAGISGLKQYGGYVREEWHPKLSGLQAVKVYREMADNDAVIGGALLAIETLIRGVPWSIDPADESTAAHAEATFVEECREDMETDWQEIVSEILTMIPFGWACFEEVYKIRRGQHENVPELHSNFDDGRIGWRNLALRSQDSLLRWDFGPGGQATAMIQQAEPDFKTRHIDLSRALLFRPRSHKNNPEGRSLLRNAYRSWFMLKKIQEVEGIGIERDLAGLPVMQVPPDMLHPKASPDQKTALETYKKMVQLIRRDAYEGVTLPAEETPDGKKTGYKLSLLTSGGRRPIDVNEIIKRYESRILISLLCEFLVLGMDKVGSFALSSDKTDLFAIALSALLDSICGVFNRIAIPRLCRINGIPQQLWPKLKHGDVSKQSLTEIGGFVAQLSNAGFDVNDPEVSAYLRDLGDLPKRRAPATAPHVLQTTAA